MMAPDDILSRLLRKYSELSHVCYRVSMAGRDERGRYRRGHIARTPHPSVLKKIDIDRALARVYDRFFASEEDGR